MKTLILMLAVLTAFAGLVQAADKPDRVKDPIPFQGVTRAVEAEPNDDCASANALTPGDPMQGAIDPVGDNDWYALDVLAGECYVFAVAPGEGQSGGDMRLWIWADDCVTEIAFDDDDGEGLYPYHLQTFDTSGTVYVEVDEFGDNGTIGAYVLSVDTCPEPQPNDTCEGAIDLQEQSLDQFQVDLCTYVPDYTPAEPECTGDYPANGNDALYKIYLTAGEIFSACIAPSDGFIDLSLWLASDCGDLENTCVAGDDSGNPECVSYEATADGWYFLVVDAYSGCGLVDVTIDAPVANEDASFSNLKTMYR